MCNPIIMSQKHSDTNEEEAALKSPINLVNHEVYNTIYTRHELHVKGNKEKITCLFIMSIVLMKKSSRLSLESRAI